MASGPKLHTHGSVSRAKQRGRERGRGETGRSTHCPWPGVSEKKELLKPSAHGWETGVVGLMVALVASLRCSMRRQSPNFLCGPCERTHGGGWVCIVGMQPSPSPAAIRRRGWPHQEAQRVVRRALCTRGGERGRDGTRNGRKEPTRKRRAVVPSVVFRPAR